MGTLNDSIKELQVWLTSHYKALLQFKFEKVTEAQQNLIQSLSQIEVPAAYIPFERFLKMKNEMSSSVIIPPYITIGQTQVPVSEKVKKGPVWMPYLLPLCKDGAFFFEGELGATGIPDLFQMIMLRLSLSIPLELCRFHMVDCDFGRSFHYFNSLQNPKIQKQLYGADEVPDLLKAMVAVLKDINSCEVGMYPNLSEYNRANPKSAKPYNFIFIDDFPRSCSALVLERLKLMMNNGNAMSAGIYLFFNFSATVDTLPRDFDLEDFKSHCMVVTSKANGESVLSGSSDIFAKQQHVNIIECAIPSNFAAIASLYEIKEAERKKPIRKFYDVPEAELWSGVSMSEVNIPVGTSEDGDEVSLHITQRNAQNAALVVGSPGSGKSKFLHSLILNAALRYSPDELEMYLLDLGGIEFEIYDRIHLPHAKVIALDSEREAVVDILERIDDEGKRRKELCRENAVGSIEALRTKTNQIVPRILVVIDGFLGVFRQNDELGCRVYSCINHIIQNHRKFSINLILSYQRAYQETSNVLLDEIGNRVAFSCNPRDSFLVGLNNTLLDLPVGHFIYNDVNGVKDANVQAQTFRMDEDDMEKAMAVIKSLSKTHDFTPKETIVCRGGIVSGDVKKVEPKDQNWRFYDIPEAELWSGVSMSEVNIPVGTSEDGDEVSLHITQQNAQNAALVVGSPGFGKSKFLHSLILNAALRYSPDELEMYLLDFSGVEFDVYDREHLPHAKVIAPESEREFGINVLEEIYNEGIRREKLCREYAVDNIKALRKKHEQMVIPRILVVIDEFQELFRQNDKMSRDAYSYMNHIIQKYRKFAINLILSSQKAYEVKSNLSVNEIGTRVAFLCNPRDSELVGLNNTSLDLPGGHFIYNAANGAKNANKKAQTFWIDDVGKENEGDVVKAIKVINGVSKTRTFTPKDTVVFRSKELPPFNPAIINPEDSPKEVQLFFGQSFSVRNSDVSVSISGESNDNVLILGGEKIVAQEIAMFMMMSATGAYSHKEKASFYIFNFLRSDNPLYDRLEACKNLDADMNYANKTQDIIDRLQHIHEEVESRKNNFDNDMQDIYIFIYAMELGQAFKSVSQGYRLVQSEAMKILGDILRDGPLMHVYTILQIDNYNNFEQSADNLMGCFNHRIALQMTSSDSNRVIKNDIASTLYVAGNEWTKYRGYYFNQSKNLQIKFRPYNSLI